MVAAAPDGSDKTAQTKPLEDKMRSEEIHADEEIPIARNDSRIRPTDSSACGAQIALTSIA